MSHPIHTLLLDIGGVLLTNGWDHQARRRAADRFHLDYDEMDQRHQLTFDTYEEGKLSLKQYLERVVFFEPRPFSLDEFQAFMFAQSQPLPGMLELFLDLKQRYRLRVAAVSNEGRELTEYRVREFALGRLVDFFIASCFVHIRKPDEDIYRVALDTAQAAPGQCIYVDDRPMFVEVARGLGIPSVLHREHSVTQKNLANLGLGL